MRISTPQIFRQGTNAILDQQAGLGKTQLQLATGKRMTAPSDDPAASARVLDLTQALDTTKQYQWNADAAKSRLGLEEYALTSVTDLLQRVRTLVVQASNTATMSNADHTAIANEVTQRLGELLNLANTRDANSEYIFAGYQGQTQPFASNNAGGFIYSGDQGSRFLQVGPTTQVAIGDSGSDMFQAIRNGNGTFAVAGAGTNTGSGLIDAGSADPATYIPDNYSITFTVVGAVTTYVVTDTTTSVAQPAAPYVDGAVISFDGHQTKITGTPANGDSFTITPSVNQDMFTTLQNLATTLRVGRSNPASLAQMSMGLNAALGALDQSLDKTVETRARIGARMNVIESQKDTNEAFTLGLNQTLSDVQDLDYASAASRLNQQMLALEAAQTTFSKVQGLSLFSFLR
jgi:flagellar hook-associated protein 3 FlgL